MRYLRRRQRLTQLGLASATDYSTAQISRLEQDRRLPNPDVIPALFVPVLGLDDEPEWIARLVALARAAHAARDKAAVIADASANSTAGDDPEPQRAPNPPPSNLRQPSRSSSATMPPTSPAQSARLNGGWSVQSLTDTGD